MEIDLECNSYNNKTGLNSKRLKRSRLKKMLQMSSNRDLNCKLITTNYFNNSKRTTLSNVKICSSIIN